jgi:hypothetical protein
MPYYIEEVPSDQSSVISGEENAPRQSTAPSDLFSSTDHCSLTTDHSFLRITKPEDIKLLDPASGSGHMLTYAFDLLVLIYEEEGYAANDIPGLILKHNLHGTEICPRAAQLAELALVFKAREKSRRFFSPGNLVRPNIIELQNVRFEENELREYFQALGVQPSAISPNLIKLLHQFEEAKNFGSLIQPCLTEAEVQNVRLQIQNSKSNIQNSADLMVAATHLKVLRVLEQAEALTQRYHVVVANPPYMGGKQMNDSYKEFAKLEYPDSKSDAFAMFIERGFDFVPAGGWSAMVTMQSWMFLSSYESLRRKLIREQTVHTLVHMANMVMGIAFGTSATVWEKRKRPNFRSHFSYISYEDVAEGNLPKKFPAENSRLRMCAVEAFHKIPGAPIVYWVSDEMRSVFQSERSIQQITLSDGQNKTGDNEKFLRHVWEPSKSSIVAKKWIPYAKGGSWRKWYGNCDLLIDWSPAARLHFRKDRIARLIPEYLWYKKGVTWSFVTTKDIGFRYLQEGGTFDVQGSTLFFENEDDLLPSLALLNSLPAITILKFLNPTISLQIENVRAVPFPQNEVEDAAKTARAAVSIARVDWDNFETSWDFRDQPLLRPGLKGTTLEASWRNWEAQSTAAIRRMQELETENNRLFIDAYGLEGELEPEVSEAQITLARADANKDMAAFLSYAVGCMMGRYSLDAEGLILADAGDTVEAYATKIASLKNSTFSIQNSTFDPDTDGIVPVLDGEWFEDDIVARTKEFLRATFGEATLSANIAFIETSLGKDLRTYFLNDFYKDHLQTYKNRPIYWLFSSGKQKAFQCLVYLHRYTPGTLARIRTEYAIPLQGKLSGRITRLEEGVANASSSAARKKLQTELDQCKKQIVELLAFDEQLRSHADQRITLDLDDGVKTNYAKFGALVAESKKVCGTKED